MKIDRTTRTEKVERVVVEDKVINEWNLTLNDEELALITKVLGATYTDKTTGNFVYDLYMKMPHEFRTGGVKQIFETSPWADASGYTPTTLKLVRK